MAIGHLNLLRSAVVKDGGVVIWLELLLPPTCGGIVSASAPVEALEADSPPAVAGALGGGDLAVPSSILRSLTAIFLVLQLDLIAISTNCCPPVHCASFFSAVSFPSSDPAVNDSMSVGGTMMSPSSKRHWMMRFGRGFSFSFDVSIPMCLRAARASQWHRTQKAKEHVGLLDDP